MKNCVTTDICLKAVNNPCGPICRQQRVEGRAARATCDVEQNYILTTRGRKLASGLGRLCAGKAPLPVKSFGSTFFGKKVVKNIS